MKTIYYIYMIYFKFIVDPDHNIVIVKLIIEQIKYIHGFNFKLDLDPVLMNFMSYFMKIQIKRIPVNITELLTTRGLAYFAMDDGSKKGVRIDFLYS